MTCNFTFFQDMLHKKKMYVNVEQNQQMVPSPSPMNYAQLICTG